jgi:hypothetical protein
LAFVQFSSSAEAGEVEDFHPAVPQN